MPVPDDPAILLSYINTQLRDFYPSLEELCKTLNIGMEETQNKLASIGYTYNVENNRFV